MAFQKIGPLTTRTNEFYEKKSIQRSFNFLVYFDVSEILDENGSPIGSMEDVFNLRSYHAVSVELPDYSFNKIETYAGPFVRTTPVLFHNGFEFTIKFEEDEKGTVKNLIHKLIRLNINEEGYHHNRRIDNIDVAVFTPDGGNRLVGGHSYRVSFKDCYFLKASPASYDYSSQEKITYDITFNCDHYYADSKKVGRDV